MTRAEWQDAHIDDRVLVMDVFGGRPASGIIADKTGPETALIELGRSNGKPILVFRYIGCIYHRY